MVLFDNPLYFLIPIGLSQLLYLVNSFTVPRYKLLAILKALYPVIFHGCFFIFLYSEDNFVLSVTCIGCLAVFLLGSLHHFIESIVKIVKSMYLLCKFILKKIKGNKGKVGQ